MPTNHTPNYNLNQWEASDRVLRTDFNSDNAKLDAALAALAAGKAEAAELAALKARTPVIHTGTYTGNGVTGRIIELGFRPRHPPGPGLLNLMFYNQKIKHLQRKRHT